MKGCCMSYSGLLIWFPSGKQLPWKTFFFLSLKDWSSSTTTIGYLVLIFVSSLVALKHDLWNKNNFCLLECSALSWCDRTRGNCCYRHTDFPTNVNHVSDSWWLTSLSPTRTYYILSSRVFRTVWRRICCRSYRRHLPFREPELS